METFLFATVKRIYSLSHTYEGFNYLFHRAEDYDFLFLGHDRYTLLVERLSLLLGMVVMDMDHYPN